MENIKIRECKNGRFELDNEALGASVNVMMHTYTHDGFVEEEILTECGRIADGFNWKCRLYFDTKEEAIATAEKILATAKEIAITRSCEKLEAKIAASKERIAAGIEDEKRLARAERNIAKNTKKIADLKAQL